MPKTRPDVSEVFPEQTPFITTELWVYIASAFTFAGVCFGIPIGYWLANL